jgi:predicted PurR-regulated permease PerM
MSQNNLSFTIRFVLGLAAFGLALAFMHQASEFIVQVLFAWIIVLSASPIFYWLRLKKVPGWLALVITLIAIIAVFGSLVVVMIIASDQLAELLGTYSEEVENFKSSVRDFIASLGISRDTAAAVADLIDPGVVLNFYAGLIADAASTLGSAIFIFMVIIFSLVEAFSMPDKIATELKKGNEYVQRLADFTIDIRRYVSITTWVGLLVGIIDTIFFIIMDVPLPLLWGLLAFLLSYIPVVGFWLAAIPPTILALLESGPLTAVIVFVGIVLINASFDEIVKPKFLGEGLDLAPVMVILSLAVWSTVLGPLGSILAVPVTMIFKELVLEADEQNAWLARLMGKGDQSRRRSNRNRSNWFRLKKSRVAPLALPLTMTVQKLILEPYYSSRWLTELMSAGPPDIPENGAAEPILDDQAN